MKIKLIKGNVKACEYDLLFKDENSRVLMGVYFPGNLRSKPPAKLKRIVAAALKQAAKEFNESENKEAK